MSDDQPSLQNSELEPINLLPLLDDAALFNQEGLLDPADFVKECNRRGLQVVNAAELEFYEQQGLLYPLLRIPNAKQWFQSSAGGYIEAPEGAMPSEDMVYGYVPYSVRGYGAGERLQWLRNKGFLFQPNREPFHSWEEFRDAKAVMRSKETVTTYYSIYQILHIQWLKQRILLEKHYEEGPRSSFIEGVHVIYDRLPQLMDFRQELYGFDQLVAFLLAIQNRYRPEASSSSVITLKNVKLEQYLAYVESFSPQAILDKLPISLEKLRSWRWELRWQGKEIDPLREWSNLVNYIDGTNRSKLRGSALLAQDFYTMAEMTSLFLRDLARQRGEEEPDPERDQEQYFQRHRYGSELNYRDIDILERILTEYNLNPHPHVLFVVEGKTEEVAIPIICEAIGIRLETYSIALHNIAGVTHGEKRNLSILTRFVAPPRLGAPVKPGLYAAARQTQVFVLFDREGPYEDSRNGKKGEEKAEDTVRDLQNKTRELLPDDLPEETKDRIAKSSITIKLWESTFEFDNFSDEELAEAISADARKKGWPEVTANEVAVYRTKFPNKKLHTIIKDKMIAGDSAVKDIKYELNKVDIGKNLAHMLARRMAHHTSESPLEVPIIEIIKHLISMAQANWP